MAKTVIDNEQVVRPEWQEWLRIVGYGAFIGVVYYIAMLIFNRYVVEPLTCRTVVDATACVTAPALAGQLVTVVAAMVALVGMIRLAFARPIIVAVTAGVLLWNLGAWTVGLAWWEAFGWSIGLYALVYGLFGWIVRQSNLLFAIIISIVLVLAINVTLILA